ncbi:MAG: hypothetical protein ACHQQR_05205 [Gemmatimonadales bacterium]
MTELVGTDRLESSSLGRRLGVRLHLLMCRHCRAYVRSLRQIADLAREMSRMKPSGSLERDELLLEAVRRHGRTLGRGERDGA